jgi:CelD/BcsL family acetyltransferase involved in cellulose biosynthesis
MSHDVRFEIVPPAEAFGPLRHAWEDLLAASGADTIFLTPAWMECWWRVYGGSRAPVFMVARRGSQVAAIVPLVIADERWKDRLTLRTLRFAGDATFDSDYLDLIAVPGDDEALVDAAWAWLRSRGPRFDWACLNEIPVTSPRYPALRATLERRGEFAEEERIGCVVSALPASWDAYLASLKPRIRTKVRSLRRGLEEKHRVEFSSCSTQEELDRRLPSLFDLHERRWKQRQQPGVFGSERKRAFYAEVSRELLGRGWLQFHTLEVDGIPVAHQYCMGYKQTVYLLQEGYDPDWEPHGVGNVLRAMVFERLIAEGWSSYDFLAGVTDHKLSWGGTVKESARLSARGRGWRGRLVAGLLGAAATLRRAPREARP